LHIFHRIPPGMAAGQIERAQKPILRFIYIQIYTKYKMKSLDRIRARNCAFKADPCPFIM